MGAAALLALGCGNGPAAAPTAATDLGNVLPDLGSAMISDRPVATDTGDGVDAGIPRDAGPSPAPTPGPQTPPTTGRTDIEAWLAAGSYRAWHCEPAPHASRAPSPHGTDRICSNDALSASTGDGPFPVGAAAVKELYATPGTVTGYSVYLKVHEGSDGADWYWYERIGTRNVADGPGSSGTARTICVGCHASAPRDFVFTQVP